MRRGLDGIHKQPLRQVEHEQSQWTYRGNFLFLFNVNSLIQHPRVPAYLGCCRAAVCHACRSHVRG